MENEFFLNAGITSHSQSTMPIWSSSAMEIHVQAAANDQMNNNNNWEKSTDHHSLQFDSALSSMVSSPVASNSNISNESFVIRELIGKLGNIGNNNNNNSGGEISPHSFAHIISNSSTNTSCYTTPLNSPPKLNNLPLMDHHFVKEKLPNLGNSMAAMNSTVADFSADPGFAERAARFSRFGSRSFNGRSTITTQFVQNNNNNTGHGSDHVMANEKLPRVTSSPSLMKLIGSDQAADRSELANSQEESSVSEQIIPNNDHSNSRKRKAVPTKATKVAKANENPNNKRSKTQREGNANENGTVKAEEANNNNNNDTKPPEPPKDYIHVRARRGQATDSHSLAERVRREKISERMKLLQDLVPGCNKVTGKALMLDEIINYVQSLQRQVEFLSMKLASVNTRLDFNVEALMSKDMYQPNKALSHSIFPIDSSASAFFSHQQQQNPAAALHGNNNISNGTIMTPALDPLDNDDTTAALCRNLNMQLSQLDQFTDSIPQFQNFCEDDDLQSIVQMGFGQNPNGDVLFPSSQSFHGSNQAQPHMKIEL